MERMLLRLFQKQTLLQCEFIMMAAHELNAGLNILKKEFEERNQQAPPDRVNGYKLTFYAIQNLLNAAANASKALWGRAGTPLSERQDLRESIGVSEDSPLKKVTMRNNFEHFDERMDKWWRQSKSHNFLDMSVMPRSAVSGLEDIDWFRVFDPQTTDLTFWSQDFNLQEIITEVQKILPKLKEEAGKPHWDP